MGALEKELNVEPTLEEEKAAIDESLANIGSLVGKLKDAPALNLNIPAPPLEEMPETISMDEYELLSIKATIWRQDSAQKSMMLANNELERVNEMREELLQRCKIKYGIPDSYQYSIDPKSKVIRLKKREA